MLSRIEQSSLVQKACTKWLGIPQQVYPIFIYSYAWGEEGGGVVGWGGGLSKWIIFTMNPNLNFFFLRGEVGGGGGWEGRGG